MKGKIFADLDYPSPVIYEQPVLYLVPMQTHIRKDR